MSEQRTEEPRTEERHFEEWLTFRKAWIKYLSAPYGLLAPVGLHWLDSHPVPADPVPGLWSFHPERGIGVDLTNGLTLTVDGVEVTGSLDLGASQHNPSFPVVEHGQVRISPVALAPSRSGYPGQVGIQVLDPNNPVLRDFQDVPTFPVDRKWVVPARFEPYAKPVPVSLHSIVENASKDRELFGRVVFELNGQEHQLEVYAGPEDELHIPFRDATSGVTTFAGSRLVFAARPSAAKGGAFTFELDFNRAVNGPCGLSPYTTCALPPPGNTLPFGVEAGEKLAPWLAQPSDWAS